jgi:glycosyltransferase involved in cell wall biosynthesis
MDICVVSFSTVIDDVRIAKEIKELQKSGFRVGGIGIGQVAPIKNDFQLTGVDLFLNDTTLNANSPQTTWSRLRKNLVRIEHCFFVIKTLIRLKPKVVHVCNLELLIAVFVPCRALKVKIVYDSFEIWADMGRVLFDNRILNAVVHTISKKLLMFIEALLVRRVDGFICVSNAMAEYFVRLYHVPAPTVVTNCPYFFAKTETKRNGSFEVLYHGNYGPGRGVEELIKSAKYLSGGATIVLRLSYISDEHRLTDLIAKCGVRDRVSVREPCRMSEVVRKASRSDVGAVFTLPTNTNHLHTVSNKIFDYINAGLPVIMSNVKEHVYLNNKHKFGIVIDDLDPEHIATAIMELRNNRILYDRLASNAVKASRELNWEVESRKLVELYSKLIEPSGLPA